MDHKKTLFSAAGGIAVCGGVCIVCGVAALKHFFGYPDIIRAEPAVIMQRLHATRHIVPYLYYFGVGGAGLCLFLFSLLFGKILHDAGEEIWSLLGKACGIVAGVLLYVGIIRYSILFPHLASMRESGVYNNEMIDLIFNAMNTYVGESVAEHAQFTFSALMFLFFGVSILKTKALPRWIGWFALATTAVILIGNLEHFGLKFAFIFNRTAAKMLALWLLSAGTALLFMRLKMKYPG